MEKVIVRQTKNLETSFFYQEPDAPESEKVFQVEQIMSPNAR